MRQRLATVLLAIPAVVLLLFAFGEMLAGDLSGSQHLVEGAPLFVLIAVARRFPRKAGAIVLIVGVALLVVWLGFVFFRGEPVWLVTGFVFFAPPLLAGWLLATTPRRSEVEV